MFERHCSIVNTTFTLKLKKNAFVKKVVYKRGGGSDIKLELIVAAEAQFRALILAPPFKSFFSAPATAFHCFLTASHKKEL